MAAPIFLRRWRSSSLPSEVVDAAGEGEGEHLNTEPATASKTSPLPPVLVVLPVLIMACSLIILGLSIYGIHTYHGSEFDDSHQGTPSPGAFPVFHLDILICSLCLSVFSVITIICQLVTHSTERGYNGVMVFGMYFFQFCLTVGTIAWYGKHAVESGHFEGIRIFYAIVGLMITLVVLLVVDMILSGNPLKKHEIPSNPREAPPGEQNQQPAKPPTPPALSAIPKARESFSEGHISTIAIAQPADVHYNPADPYHPLRMNPPEYSPAMDQASRLGFRTPERLTPEKVIKTAPEIPYQVVGDRNCFLCG